MNAADFVKEIRKRLPKGTVVSCEKLENKRYSGIRLEFNRETSKGFTAGVASYFSSERLDKASKETAKSLVRMICQALDGFKKES